MKKGAERVVEVVESITICKVLEKAGKLTHIKIDCEGSEYAFLPELWAALPRSVRHFCIEYDLGQKQWLPEAEQFHRQFIAAKWKVVVAPRFHGKKPRTAKAYYRRG